MSRLFDVILSAIALICLTPFLLFVCVLLKFTGEGEIFYRQERIGQNGNAFGLLKFATMLKNSPHLSGGTITTKNDPRILPFGRFLRKSKINELPQLINVFIGDMSLIGPRPMTNENLTYYNEVEKKVILKMKPGLSGIGSIIFHNEESLLIFGDKNRDFYANIIAPYKAKLEIWYHEKQGFKIYLKLIFLTVYMILTKENKLLWRFFHDLPMPPDEIKSKLSQ